MIAEGVGDLLLSFCILCGFAMLVAYVANAAEHNLIVQDYCKAYCVYNQSAMYNEVTNDACYCTLQNGERRFIPIEIADPNNETNRSSLGEFEEWIKQNWFVEGDG